MKWISVKDQKPPFDEEILGCTDQNVALVYYEMHECTRCTPDCGTKKPIFRYARESWNPIAKVCHWLPIPKLRHRKIEYDPLIITTNGGTNSLTLQIEETQECCESTAKQEQQ